MTHTGAMPEDQGTFGIPRLREDITCRKCQQTGKVWVQIWESDDGAYEDEKFTCDVCKAVWWIDGIDS